LKIEREYADPACFLRTSEPRLGFGERLDSLMLVGLIAENLHEPDWRAGGVAQWVDLAARPREKTTWS
jgi:hypothetical protein